MRLPHNEAGAIRLPFGRNDGEDRLKLFQRPQALVRKVRQTSSYLSCDGVNLHSGQVLELLYRCERVG